MTTINDAYINALLADSAYVDSLLPGMTGSILADKITGRMTPDLAKYIGDSFAVVSQVGGLASSFDATVWRGNAGTPYAGQVFVSMRGDSGSDSSLSVVLFAPSSKVQKQIFDDARLGLRHA